MTLYNSHTDFAVWRGEPINGVIHPLIIEKLWSDDELIAAGLYKESMIENTPVPEGKVVTGREVQLINDQPKWVYTLEDAPPPTSMDVDAERDRRIVTGFIFDNKLYQSRNEDRENIAGAALAALAAQMAGAQPDDLRWHGGDSDFVWIAADNSLTPMDAQTMFAFGQAAMVHKQAHIFAARALKDADPIPTDYKSENYWP